MMLATRRGLSFPRARPKRRIQATRTRVIRLVQPESVLHNQVVQLAEMYGWRGTTPTTRVSRRRAFPTWCWCVATD